MSPASQISRLAPYLARLLEDEYVQEQIRDTVKNLRRGSARARKQSAREALSDRRVQSHLMAAAGSLAKAVKALKQPDPPRHRLRKGLLLVAAGGAGVWAWQRRGS